MSSHNFRITADGRLFRLGRKRYPSGDLYQGEFVDGVREGRGTLEYSNGNRYTGEWFDNQFHGFGVFTWAPFQEGKITIRGRRYEGNWENALKSGFGILIMGQGDVYEGNFEEDRFGGMGTMKLANGDIKSGTWKRGTLNGYASIHYANGDHYEGDFSASKFQGKGKFTYAYGRGWYEGGYLAGLKHGRGVRIFSNNNRYDGEFVNGLLHGDGIMECANGEVYMGAWERGQRHGRGVLRLRSGDKYEGTFFNGFMFGQGKYTFADGSYYDGEFGKRKGGYGHGVTFPDPNGKKHGRGIRVWCTGDKYEGEWLDDYPHGLGIVMKQSGGKFEGHFVKGQRTGAGAETWGNVLNLKFTCPVGHIHAGRGFCRYEGKFLNGYFHGPGHFQCLDGRSYHGQWCRGRRHGWGEQIMIPDSQRGDARRHFIGGIDALYRPVSYRGEWRDGLRTGEGVVVYASGLEMGGELIAGKFEGVVKYLFPKCKSVRLAVFRGGERISWILDSKQQVMTRKESASAESVLAEILGGASAALELFKEEEEGVVSPKHGSAVKKNKKSSPNRVLFQPGI
mmetsp:Transcript_51429/g.65851  ORF Transcript_51429/g.65851 Transcript_51429/m.65851 type:complete len:564 (-) Transcript_51429:142-1833(-)